MQSLASGLRQGLRVRSLRAAASSSSSALQVSAPPQKAVELDMHTAGRVLDNLDCLLFDCDGVLWTGSRQVPGAARALQVLRDQGKRVLFVTNNASKSRQSYVNKFTSLGLQVEAHEIISASYAAAAYLESQGFACNGKKVLLLGNVGVEQELDTACIPWVGGTDWQPPLLPDTDALAALQLDADIGAVLVSWDPAFSYSRLSYASSCLRELPGCLFVATNPDDADTIGPPLRAAHPGAPLPSSTQPATTHTSTTSASNGQSLQARMMPGTGCIIAAVQAAAGRQPVVVGKGGPWLLPFLLQHFKLDPRRTAIVGDRLDTDIFLGLEGGLTTILPLTGVTTRQQALACPPAEAPHYILPSIAALAGLP